MVDNAAHNEYNRTVKLINRRSLVMAKKYIVKQNPDSNLWYCLGAIKAKKKVYYIPVSVGYIKRASAVSFRDAQPLADKDAIRCIDEI